MKKLFFFLSFCLFHFISQAQAPQGIPYQSVLRNGSGALITNHPVSIRFSIHDSTMQGNIVYQETHNTTTSNGGMVILNIGLGTPVTGTFSAINWGVNSKFMQVELDTTGVGTNYVDLGTQQLMSVPYALYAKTTGSISLPPGASQGQVLTFCDGNYVWTNGGICPANVATIDCSNSTNMGVLIANYPANNVSSTITYTGGNGGAYPTQTVSSTGVTGLTATLAAGSLNNGNGSLTFVISGTPNDAGTATFVVNVGGKSCTLHWNVIAIGSNYAGGIVFYVDSTGQHGLVCAPFDQGAYEWGCYGSWVNGTSTLLGTGLANTNAILSSCSQGSIAASICSNLFLNGYNDWFLPSLDELKLMQQNLSSIPSVNFMNYWYWSSSHAHTYLALVVNLQNGTTSDINKNNLSWVRAIRSF